MYGTHHSVGFPPWLLVVVLSAIALYMVIGIGGSVMRVHSKEQFDDDRNWFLGFYNNPDDYDLLVPSRILKRTTVNIGRPVGMAFTILVLLMFVGLAVGVALASYK